MSLLPRCAALTVCIAFHTAVVAQATLPVGVTQTDWANTTGSGSAKLTSVVHYPAQAAGVDAPLATRVGGWPVIVFLHGYAAYAANYATLGDAWAARGYVVVLSDTSLTDWFQQPLDGRALHTAVLAANTDSRDRFFGALDTSRIALAGHSMGGASTVSVLTQNPGYDCGFVIAPALPVIGSASDVQVPFGVVAGLGDWITPPAGHASPIYTDVDDDAPLKFYHLLDSSADHGNIVALFGGAHPAFQHTVEAGDAFFQHCFGYDVRALEKVCGPTAEQAPLMFAASFDAAKPQMWLSGDLRIGQTTSAWIAARPGVAILGVGSSLGPALPTEFGSLMLDPYTGFVTYVGMLTSGTRLEMPLFVPNDPALDGLPVALQGLGMTAAQYAALGNAGMLHVKP